MPDDVSGAAIPLPDTAEELLQIFCEPPGAELIQRRFFTGPPNVEAAAVPGIAEGRTSRTRAWLFEE